MSEPVVEVAQGRLRGRVDRNRDGGEYRAFFGVPYAKPPLGELRFKAPRPAEPWTGVRDATSEGDECYSKHMIFQNPVGSEDCLVLNVFTPEVNHDSNLRPVMVWIHGGGFNAGSSKTEMYGPEFLMCEDVVLVTINYRLGVLGFLSLDDPTLGVPGNAGLKDMVMALKWVQENIRQFNGDPSNVTIFGESAGSASVHYLMLSPMAKNLFHKAVMQSGCATNLWACGERCGKELAGYLGCDSSDEKEILRVLQAATKEQILDVQHKCKDPVLAKDTRPHGPIVEKPSPDEPSFLPDTPSNIMASGNYNKVPVLMGMTSREGMLYQIMENRMGLDLKVRDFENAVPCTLNLAAGSTMSKKIAAMIKEFYYGDEEPNPSNVDSFYQLQSDNFFVREINTTAKQFLASLGHPIYFYLFDVESQLNLYKILGKVEEKGVCHADDLGYLFKTLITPTIKPGSIEDVTVRRLTKWWATFAKTGNPNPSEKSDLFPIEWPQAHVGDFKYLHIAGDLSVGANPEEKRMKFWENVFTLASATNKL